MTDAPSGEAVRPEAASREAAFGHAAVRWTRVLIMGYVILTCGWFVGAGISDLVGTPWPGPWELWLLGPWATAPLVCALVTWPASRRVPDGTFVPLAGALVMPGLAFLLGAWPTVAVTVAPAIVLLVRPKAARHG